MEGRPSASGEYGGGKEVEPKKEVEGSGTVRSLLDLKSNTQYVHYVVVLIIRSENNHTSKIK